MLMSTFLVLVGFFVIFDKIFLFWSGCFILFFLVVEMGCNLNNFKVFYGEFIMDFWGVLLIFLTVWVFFYCFSIINNLQMIFFWIMFIFLVYAFSLNSVIMFYIMFEFVFLLMFVYLLKMGKTAERLQASFYMMFYTLIFSLPFLIFLFYYYLSFYGVSSFIVMDMSNSLSYNWLSIFTFLVFMTKLPIYGLHLWLPKAHVEAPVEGSMLLAGVFLKLGGYGMYRFLGMFMSWGLLNSFLLYFYYLSLLGSIVVSYFCLRQNDMKIIIAYSSVVHMNFMILGFLSFSNVGLYGVLLMLISHGLVSSFLFYSFNYVYEFTSSRSIFMLKGCMFFSSLFAFFWLMGLILNLSFPPFMSFFSEIFIINIFMMMGIMDWILLIIFCFICCLYNIYLYIFLTHGKNLMVNSTLSGFMFMFMGIIHLSFVFIFPLINL